MFALFRKIAFKLAVLAGVPVIGVLLLAAEVERTTRDRARSADAIGSIEDLAELSARMSDAVDELQSERASAALALGLREADPPDPAAAQKANLGLLTQQGKTDNAVDAMNSFLAQRDRARLPAGLRGDLDAAQVAFEQAQGERRRIAQNGGSIDAVLESYGRTDDALIDATAALTHLSDDGEMLRSLASLVAIMQVQECDSREHAVLSHTFARGQFAPGMYRYLVTLLTEQRVHAASWQSFASAEQFAAYRRVQDSPAAVRAAQMLKMALEVTEDNLNIDAADWFAAQQAQVQELARVEEEHAQRVRQIARNKVDETRRAVRYGEALVLAVVLGSVLLAVVIGRGITRNILGLSKIAGQVRREKDFSLRAVKQSSDELGTLTDAFNEMLTGIQDRDEELSLHRENLEKLVAERTIALSKRNDEMRLVLDTVDQGLATLDPSGRISAERSRAFDSFFGAPRADAPYFEHIAGADRDLALALELDWSQLSDGFLPVELVLAQAKSQVQIGENHFTLGYKPILEREELKGALLTVTNVTGEIVLRRKEAVQRELLKTFERVMKDRAGFLEFFREAERLLERIRDDRFESDTEKLRAIHTLKGNAALFDVARVAEAAHALERAIASGEAEEAARQALGSAWDGLSDIVRPLVGEELGERYEITRAELDQIVRAIKGGRSEELERLVAYVQGEPLRIRLERVAAQLQALSVQLDKGEPAIQVSGGQLRVPKEALLPFWAAFAHVVRNVVDHGLQSAEERRLAGKPERNQVTLSARLEHDSLLIEIADDGRGIDWSEVALRAKARGLPHRSRAELVAAIFAPGFSTTSSVSETSGRGIGMSAVLEACRELGGRCVLDSETGRGTKLTFTLSLSALEQAKSGAHATGPRLFAI
jgi:two-component system chemotaxis sensor kinase CheA